MLARLYQNHVLTNLVFVLVLIVGVLSYLQMPRQQDPTINFNWIDISTLAPGMAAQDVEQRVTDIIEEGIRKVSDIKFVQSTSRDSFSNILVRFNELGEREFDKRLNDLRREIQDKQRQFPEGVEDPAISEITTANAFPSATVVVTGIANDANLRLQSERVKKDLERISGVDRILDTALQQPELKVLFDPDKLERLGLTPGQLADVVGLQYRDISAGSKQIGDDSWLVRYQRMQLDAVELAKTPMFGAHNDITLGQLANVQPGWEKPQHYVLWEGWPAVMLAVTKQGSANTLDLVERIKSYIESTRAQREVSGVKLYLADDQTEITRNALNIMQTNAAIGLLMVLLVAWLFLGFRVAILTAIAIPFILAGTFWVLQSSGETLNVMVLLGVVISLGMLVDDAVVVVESIYYRLQRHEPPLDAVINGFKEVVAPVTTAVLTTIAAFLPLMLLPGIIGKFMRIVPFVVTVALLISLLEAFWILPSHILNARLDFKNQSRSQHWRKRFLRKLRRSYTKILIRVMRFPALIHAMSLFVYVAALFSAFAGQINPALMQDPAKARWLVKTDFFASDPLRLFYITVEMENGTPLEVSLDKIRQVQAIVHQRVEKKQLRSVVAYAGQAFTETAPLQGAHYGQLLVSLPPTKGDDLLSVDEVIERLRAPLDAIAGPKKLYFIRLAGGPPTSKAISVKVRGNDIGSIRTGVQAIKAMLIDSGWAQDITDDDSPGLKEMALTINQDAMQRSGVNLADVLRSLRLLVDGEVVAEVREQGETLQVRVKAMEAPIASIESLLDFELVGKNGVKLT